MNFIVFAVTSKNSEEKRITSWIDGYERVLNFFHFQKTRIRIEGGGGKNQSFRKSSCQNCCNFYSHYIWCVHFCHRISRHMDMWWMWIASQAIQAHKSTENCIRKKSTTTQNDKILGLVVNIISTLNKTMNFSWFQRKGQCNQQNRMKIPSCNERKTEVKNFLAFCAHWRNGHNTTNYFVPKKKCVTKIKRFVWWIEIVWCWLLWLHQRPHRWRRRWWRWWRRFRHHHSKFHTHNAWFWILFGTTDTPFVPTRVQRIKLDFDTKIYSISFLHFDSVVLNTYTHIWFYLNAECTLGIWTLMTNLKFVFSILTQNNYIFDSTLFSPNFINSEWKENRQTDFGQSDLYVRWNSKMATNNIQPISILFALNLIHLKAL